jgi:hypothetical protein
VRTGGVWVGCCAVGLLVGAMGGVVLGLAVWLGAETDGIHPAEGSVYAGVAGFLLVLVVGLAIGAGVATVLTLLRRSHAPAEQV